jgi:hypothetical protein
VTGRRDDSTGIDPFPRPVERVAKPFNWKLTRTNLDDLLDRIDAHETQPLPRLAA